MMERSVENLDQQLNIVNSWINNCDQKAGIIMAFAGVILTQVLTSQFVNYMNVYIFSPFVEYWFGKSDTLCFHLYRFLTFIVLVFLVYYLVRFFFCMFRVITPNIDYSKLHQNNSSLPNTSYIFFGTVAKMNYSVFKDMTISYKEDLLSQIYVNSIIAEKKFTNYQKGIRFFKCSICISVILLVLMIFLR